MQMNFRGLAAMPLCFARYVYLDKYRAIVLRGML